MPHLGGLGAGGGRQGRSGGRQGAEAELAEKRARDGRHRGRTRDGAHGPLGLSRRRAGLARGSTAVRRAQAGGDVASWPTAFRGRIARTAAAVWWWPFRARSVVRARAAVLARWPVRRPSSPTTSIRGARTERGAHGGSDLRAAFWWHLEFARALSRGRSGRRLFRVAPRCRASRRGSPDAARRCVLCAAKARARGTAVRLPLVVRPGDARLGGAWRPCGFSISWPRPRGLPNFGVLLREPGCPHGGHVGWAPARRLLFL